jgi:hypothetical protein
LLLPSIKVWSKLSGYRGIWRRTAEEAKDRCRLSRRRSKRRRRRRRREKEDEEEEASPIGWRFSWFHQLLQK